MSIYYEGVPLEKGGTSIQGLESPAVRWVYEKYLKGREITVLDFGAGKFARNSDFLRKNNLDTFAFDPYNYNSDDDGWSMGSVSSGVSLENNAGTKFDVCITCFVLNVLPKWLEIEVLHRISSLSVNSVHIVRNRDVVDSVKAATARGDKTITQFVVDHLKIPVNEVDVEFLCKYGVQTSKGFQRVTDIEDLGFSRVKTSHGYSIFTNIKEV